MAEIGAGMGFCGGVVDGRLLHVDMFIPESGRVSADEFAGWVLDAEGMVRADERKRFAPPLREAFIRHFGGDLVDASALKWAL